MALEPITRQEKIIAGQDLTPITRMEKFLKQYGGGSGGVTSWNDLTDKPFGETTTVKEVLAECQPEFDGEYFIEVVSGIVNVVAGQEYIVSWNGIDHICKAADSASAGFDLPGVVLGNYGAMSGASTGEPFVIMVAETDGNTGFSCIPMDGSTEMTISIRQEVTTVQKMSGKYVEGMGWSDKSVETVIPEQTVTLQGMNAPPAYVSIDLSGRSVFVGANVTVVWNGTTFDCVASDFTGVVGVGNKMIIGTGEDTGEPFCIGFDGNISYVYSGVAGTATVSVMAETEKVHTIDKKLIPDLENEFAIHFNLAGDGSDSYDLVADKPVNDILVAYQAYGKTIKAYAALWGDPTDYLPLIVNYVTYVEAVFSTFSISPHLSNSIDYTEIKVDFGSGSITRKDATITANVYGR